MAQAGPPEAPPSGEAAEACHGDYMRPMPSASRFPRSALTGAHQWDNGDGYQVPRRVLAVRMMRSAVRLLIFHLSASSAAEGCVPDRSMARTWVSLLSPAYGCGLAGAPGVPGLWPPPTPGRLSATAHTVDRFHSGARRPLRAGP